MSVTATAIMAEGTPRVAVPDSLRHEVLAAPQLQATTSSDYVQWGAALMLLGGVCGGVAGVQYLRRYTWGQIM